MNEKSKVESESVDARVPEKLAQAILRHAVNGRLAVAYSGGLDSRFLSFCAAKLGLTVVLLHVAGPHIPAEESDSAERDAIAMRARFQRVETDMEAVAHAAQAGRDRCYVCKHALMQRLLSLTPDGVLCDGTNASDSLSFRPGARALMELGIVSPLAEAGLTKKEIYLEAEKLGMPNPKQAAKPCLLTRFAYGLVPNDEKLRRIEKMEACVSEWAAKTGRANLHFRVRFAACESLELHVAQSDVPDEDRDAFVEDVMHELAHWEREQRVTSVRFLTKLSGFFD